MGERPRTWVIGTVMLVLGMLLITGWILTGEDQQNGGDSTVASVATTLPSPIPSPVPPEVTPTSTPTRAPTEPPESLGSSEDLPTEAVPPTPSPTDPTPPEPTSASGFEETIPAEQEAEAVVEAYFAALDEDRYDDAKALTAGQAREQTDAGVAELQRESENQGMRIHLQVIELNTTAQAADSTARPVQVEYLVAALADTIFGTMTADELRSEAIFRVARLPEGDRIVFIDGELVPTE